MNSLLPLGEVTDRLRIVGQSYAGMRTIPIDHIVGSVDRSIDFDRCFKPRRKELRREINAMRRAFGDRPLPPISVYEASGLYFVSDGHHRVALARQDGTQFIDAEVTALRLSHELTPDADVMQLIHTEQHRQFKQRTGLLVRHPEANIQFSRPIGYGELLDIVEAHAYELSTRRGELVALEEATADWYDTSWVPAQAAIDEAGLRPRYWFKTAGDLYLWTFQKLRELRTVDREATWQTAAACRAADPVQRSHMEVARREQRMLLPSA